MAHKITRNITKVSDIKKLGMNVTNECDLVSDGTNVYVRIGKEYRQIDNVREAINEEVVEARGTYPNLNTRLTKMDDIDRQTTTQLAQTEGQLNSRMDTIISLPEGSTTNDARLEDIKVGFNGRIYSSPGSAVRSQLKLIDHQSKIIAPLVSEVNKTKGATWVDGGFIFPVTGEVNNHADYSYTYLPMLSNKKYLLKKVGNIYGAYFDGNGDFISGVQDQGSGVTIELTTPENAVELAFSCLTTNIGKIDLSIDSTVYLNHKIFVHEDNVIKENETITVSKDGTKDYTSLRAAVESIGNNIEEKKYTIEFYGDGTEYNLSNEYTPTERKNSNGLLLPEHVKLVGIGGTEKCIIACRLTVEESNRYFSTINLRATSELEGITFIGEYTRNVLHEDFGTLENTNKKIKNCHFIGSNLNLNYVSANGVLSGAEVGYENCVFECLTTSDYPYACHNNINFTEPAKLHFKNCRFKYLGSTLSVKLGSLNTNANDIVCIATFEGCKIPVQLRLSEENAGAYGTGILWKVNGYGNHIDDVKVLATDGVDYSNRIDFI